MNFAKQYLGLVNRWNWVKYFIERMQFAKYKMNNVIIVARILKINY